MKSITNAKGNWQVAKAKPIEVFDSGISIPRMGAVFVPSCLTDPDRKQRGEITGFSVKARKRLRRCMLSELVPDAQKFGVTYTLPWKGRDFTPFMDEFRECWHRFGVLFRRSFPNSAMIFRVELQQSGKPHVHALTYIKYPDGIPTLGGAPVVAPQGGDVVRDLIYLSLQRLWEKSVPDLHHGSIMGFWKHGVKVEPLKNEGAMMRYICDHTSKHKQAQLGYKGKQWGKIGDKNLVKAPSVSLPDFENFRHEVLFLRMLKKAMRYRVTDYRRKKPWKRQPPFGSILRGSARTVGEFYIGSDSVRRMWEFAKCQSIAS